MTHPAPALPASYLAALPRWLRALLALVAGGLTPLALAPLGWWPLALLTPVTLALISWRQSRRTTLQLALLFGLGLFGIGASWVFVSIHDFGNAPAWLAALLTALFVAFLALVFALPFALLNRRQPQPERPVGPYLLAFAGLWLLGEWLRSWLLTGFPWLYLGYSQWQTPLAGWAPIGGVLGLSLTLLLSGGGLAYLLLSRHRGRQLAVALGLLLLWGGGEGLRAVDWTRPAAAPVSVSLVQANIPQAQKWQPGFLQPTLDRYRSLSEDAWQADWVIWPEAAIPLLYHRAKPLLEEMHQRALQTDTALITGILYDHPEQRIYHNSATGLGLASGLYHKTRLVPFGEYVPLEQWLRGLIEFFNLPMSVITPGARQQPDLQIGELRLATAICYEIVYPDLVAASARQRSVILTLSNDAWFGRSWGPLQHLEMARMRALETRRPVIRGTNNGVSALINPRGQLQASGPQFVQTVVSGQITPRQGDTPFMLWGSLPVVALGALLWLAGSRRPGPRR